MGQRLNFEVRLSEEPESVILNIYYHWSGYTIPALQIAKDIWSRISEYNLFLDEFLFLDIKPEDKIRILRSILPKIIVEIDAARLDAKSRKKIGMSTKLSDILLEAKITNELDFDVDFAEESYDVFETKLDKWAKKYDKEKNASNIKCFILQNILPSRNNGIMSIVEEEIEETRSWAEAEIFLILSDDSIWHDVGGYYDASSDILQTDYEAVGIKETEDGYDFSNAFIPTFSGKRKILTFEDDFAGKLSFEELCNFLEMCEEADEEQSYVFVMGDTIFTMIA